MVGICGKGSSHLGELEMEPDTGLGLTLLFVTHFQHPQRVTPDRDQVLKPMNLWGSFQSQAITHRKEDVVFNL